MQWKVLPIIKLADLNSLWLETQVNVNYAKNLKIGQKASITFTDFPDKTINAKVAFINPEINPDTRLLLIRMEIPNPDLQLKPGMQAMVKLTQSNVKDLYIPIDAVIREENASYIWVEKRPGIFENVNGRNRSRNQRNDRNQIRYRCLKKSSHYRCLCHKQ